MNDAHTVSWRGTGRNKLLPSFENRIKNIVKVVREVQGHSEPDTQVFVRAIRGQERDSHPTHMKFVRKLCAQQRGLVGEGGGEASKTMGMEGARDSTFSRVEGQPPPLTIRSNFAVLVVKAGARGGNETHVICIRGGKLSGIMRVFGGRNT
jgi:hypothetical protein